MHVKYHARTYRRLCATSAKATEERTILLDGDSDDDAQLRNAAKALPLPPVTSQERSKEALKARWSVKERLLAERLQSFMNSV